RAIFSEADDRPGRGISAEYRRSAPLPTARDRVTQVARLGHQLAPVHIHVVPRAPVHASRLELPSRQRTPEVLRVDPREPGPGAADPFQDVGARGPDAGQVQDLGIQAAAGSVAREARGTGVDQLDAIQAAGRVRVL